MPEVQTKPEDSCDCVRLQDLPGPVLEQVLAHVPFHERVRAAAVCRAWHQHLSQRGLPLWQAVSIDYGNGGWDSELDDKRLLFQTLKCWLERNGKGVLHLQCRTSFLGLEGTGGNGWLSEFLATVGREASSLQALRLDGSAARSLRGSSLMDFVVMGRDLRQLALIGLQRVSQASLGTALRNLPALQDLAVVLARKEEVDYRWDPEADEEASVPMCKPPNVMELLVVIAESCQALQTLTLGHQSPQDPADLPLAGKPLPAEMSRLSKLSSLMLHNVGWEYAPGGLPHLPQLRRLYLNGGSSGIGDLQAFIGQGTPDRGLPHQLSTLTGLETLQATLPEWPGRLPPSLTHLVLAPWEGHERRRGRANDCASFVHFHLPPLQGLRHLAFHRLRDTRNGLLTDVCAAAGALPQLVSLHLVDCNICGIPVQMCELSQLQMLNLSENFALHEKGCSRLAKAPLHKLASCRHLDLRCDDAFYSYKPMQPETIAAIAAMPSLEQLALPVTRAYAPEPASPEELAQIKQCREPGMPPIRVVTNTGGCSAMPDMDRWATVGVEVPFAEASDMLGVQLDRSIVPGFPSAR